MQGEERQGGVPTHTSSPSCVARVGGIGSSMARAPRRVNQLPIARMSASYLQFIRGEASNLSALHQSGHREIHCHTRTTHVEAVRRRLEPSVVGPPWRGNNSAPAGQTPPGTEGLQLMANPEMIAFKCRPTGDLGRRRHRRRGRILIVASRVPGRKTLDWAVDPDCPRQSGQAQEIPSRGCLPAQHTAFAPVRANRECDAWGGVEETTRGHGILESLADLLPCLLRQERLSSRMGAHLQNGNRTVPPPHRRAQPGTT